MKLAIENLDCEIRPGNFSDGTPSVVLSTGTLSIHVAPDDARELATRLRVAARSAEAMAKP